MKKKEGALVKNGSTLFLKVIILLMGLAVLAGLILFPQTEGRAKGLDLLAIYADPVIAYIYIASIPFFIALYQAFTLLGYIEQNNAFSHFSVNALRNIKYCAIAIIVFIIGAEAYLIFAVHGEDKTGPIALEFYTGLITIVIATFAAVLQKLFQNAVDIKAENDLTV